MNIINFTQRLAANIVRSISGLKDSFQPKGKFFIEHFDKDGNFLAKYEIPNGIVDVGKNSLLDVYFRNQTQLPTWHIGIVDNSGFTAFADGDTMSSHSGWAEFTTYSESTRVQWSPSAAVSKSISNSTPSTFNITGTATLKGIFVTSNNTKGGTTGTLWSTAAFASTIAVNNGDQLKITYTVNA